MVSRVCDNIERLSDMTIVNRAKIFQRRNVLVGIRFDGQEKELLSWALVKVADSGDQVIAVHLSRITDDPVKEKMMLDELLDSYRDLCNIKKIDLLGKILQGNSLRKSLIREAKSCNPVAVIVGTSNQATLGGKFSAAKYCSKHLPFNTEVLSIHNGKIVFRRSSSTAQISGRDPRPSINRLSDHRSSISESHSELGDERPNLVSTGRIRTHKRSNSISDSNLEQKTPGWPLLRRSSVSSHGTLEARKMSVVQWVMNLPSRFPNETSEETPQSDGWDLCLSTALGFPFGGGIGYSPDIRRNSQSLWGEIPKFDMYSAVSPSDFTCFSYEVLKSSTSQFASENLIGKGGCSRVYKGHFPDGKSVAVKVTNSSKAAWEDFSREIEIISSLKHKNITPLFGVCIENSKLISVYEFMSNGSLEENLHGDLKGYVLPWETRFKVAVGIADTLNYLHNGFSRTVIHRDVKSSNILLSDEFEPQLSDFGLAVWGPTNSSSETYDDVVGTFGYLAPEYFMYGKVSDKVDVYSFGVVLLELLSGRKPIDSSKGQESLVMWAKPILLGGKLRGILDPKLKANVDGHQMQRMILAATLCLTRSARLRPSMNQILNLLRGEESIEKWTNSYKETSQEEEEGTNNRDDEVYTEINKKLEYINLVMLDMENDDMTSIGSSMERSSTQTTLEDYLMGLNEYSISVDLGFPQLRGNLDQLGTNSVARLSSFSPHLDPMDDGEVDFSNQELFTNPMGGDIPDNFFEELLNDTHHACTHTHTCNPQGPDYSHTHTCFHVHTKILSNPSDQDDSAESVDKKTKKRPSGNREAVRKYREKKKARAASLEDEVIRLTSLNQQLMRRLQGQAALEAEAARLKCLLVDVRGRIEGEIGSFPYQRLQNSASPCNVVLQCGDQSYCPGKEGNDIVERGLNGEGFGGCDFDSLNCFADLGSGSKECLGGRRKGNNSFCSYC
ncbi:hypothetical protein V2J09_015533 [Rumex salicifolius]